MGVDGPCAPVSPGSGSRELRR